MKQIPNLTVILECFPVDNTFVIRLPNGAPISVKPSLEGATEVVEHLIEVQSQSVKAAESAVFQNTAPE